MAQTPQVAESLFSEVIRFAEQERLVEAEIASVHARAGLDTIRREIEQIIFDFHANSAVYVGLGSLSDARGELDHYRRLAEACDGVYLFGEPDARIPPSQGLHAVSVKPPALAHDYFCIAAGAGYLVALIGAEVPVRAGEPMRRYNALLTFERKLVAAALSVLAPVMAAARIEAPPPVAMGDSFAVEQSRRNLRTVLANRLASRVSSVTRQLQQNTLVDPLTGLYNHEHFYATLIRKANQFGRLRRPFDVMFLDIREESPDRPGGAIRVLEEPVRALAGCLTAQLRKGVDLCFKLKRNEFAAILDGATEQDAARVALRVQESFRKRKFPGLELKIAVSDFSNARRIVSLLDHAKRRLREGSWS